MGVRTAAAKLGLGLAAVTSNKKIWCSSSNSRLLGYTKRANSSLATTTDGTASVEKSSSLYLCFDGRTRYPLNKLFMYADFIVRPIRYDVHDGDYDNDEELLEDASHSIFDYKDIIPDYSEDSWKEKFCKRMAAQTKIICFGSKILFTVGQTIPNDIGWVDPSTHPVKFHISSKTETKIKSFSTPKSDMRWGAIDGKIYCFNKCPLRPSQCFEVLDPETENSEWERLSQPPFIRTDGATDTYNVLYLNESRKILGWEDNERGVFLYDTRKPETGWIESPSCIGDSIPFIGRYDRRVVIRDNHSKLGDFNLMFRHDSYNEPFVVFPYFISDECDSFCPIHEPILLPKYLCSDYRAVDSQFVHLGSKKFCLILHKSSRHILLLTFEYDVIVNETEDSEPPIEIKTRMLGSRRFYYNNIMESTKTDMIGAFLL